MIIVADVYCYGNRADNIHLDQMIINAGYMASRMNSCCSCDKLSHRNSSEKQDESCVLAFRAGQR